MKEKETKDILTAVEFGFVELGDGFVGVIVRYKLDEAVAERARASGDDVGAGDFANSLKGTGQICIACLEGEIANENFRGNSGGHCWMKDGDETGQKARKVKSSRLE